MTGCIVTSEFRGVEFHIIKGNFQVNIAPQRLFKSNIPTVAPALQSISDGNNDRMAGGDIISNAIGGPGLSKEIKHLWAEGIEVEDDN